MQEDTWATYAAAVKDHATQMQAAHNTMVEAMGTATWRERRDMMNTMFATRQQAMTAVHDAAGTLAGVLTPAQRSQATGILPGMMGRGPRRPASSAINGSMSSTRPAPPAESSARAG